MTDPYRTPGRLVGKKPFRDNAIYHTSDPPIHKVEWLDPKSEKTVFVTEGDVWEFVCDVSTRAGHTHPKGSLLFVHDRTGQTPHDEIGPRRCNWLCRTQYGVSVWATLEHCIERGLLKKVRA